MTERLPGYSEDSHQQEQNEEDKDGALSPVYPQMIIEQYQNSLCDLFCCNLLDIAEVVLLVILTMCCYYYSDLSPEIELLFKRLLMVCIPFAILELWLICVGFIGKITKDGKNGYRYSSHWSFFFSLLLFPTTHWKHTRNEWRNGTITLINTSRYNTIRIIITTHS